MKRMIATVCAVAMVSCVTSIAFAETGEQPVNDEKVAQSVKLQSSNEKMMPPPEEQLKRLTKGLVLTAEQQTQIRPILVDEFAKLKEFRKDENLNPKQIQVKVEALRSETVDKMKVFLNPDQRVRLDQVSKEIKASKQQRVKENRKARIGTPTDSPIRQPKP
jgi:hypothetical protein